MIRGTTPTLQFKLPFETSLLSAVYITFAQNEKAVIEKELHDCTAEGRTLTLRLTQEDTLKLVHSANVAIQLRAKTNAGEALASNIITTSVYKILKDGVI